MAESEVIVIGGGIAGASTAWRLAEHGRSVTLLERGEIASEASGVNAGGIGAYGWGHVPNLEAYLTMGSLQIFRSLQLDLGYDIEFRTAGALQAIQTPEQFEYSRDNVLSLKSRGYTVDLLNVDEARSIEPELDPELKGVVHFPLRAQADPVKATRAFALAARDLGANVLTGREVTGISSGPEGTWNIDCSGEVHTAGQLVLAAGGWCQQLGRMLGLQIPILPVRGQMWATEPLPPRVFHSISAAESPLHWSLSPGHDSVSPPELTHIGSRRVTRHLYGRQTRDGEVIFGGDRQMASYDKTVDAGGVESEFRARGRGASLPSGTVDQPDLVGPDAFSPGWAADHRQDTAKGEPFYRQRPGLIRLWQRPDGWPAHRRLCAHWSPPTRPFGVRPG